MYLRTVSLHWCAREKGPGWRSQTFAPSLCLQDGFLSSSWFHARMVCKSISRLQRNSRITHCSVLKDRCEGGLLCRILSKGVWRKLSTMDGLAPYWSRIRMFVMDDISAATCRAVRRHSMALHPLEFT